MDGAVAASATLKKATDPQQYPHTPEDLRKEPNYPIWVRLRAGDRSARDELVVRYAPLVKYVIGRMAISLPAAMDSDDVLSAGTVGLLHAIDRFDPDQGVRFETYGLQRIRGAIIDTIRSLSPLSRGAGRRARILDETTAALAQVLGRAPTQDELARELGVDIQELGRMLLESAHVIVSLDGAGAGGEDDGDVQSLRDLLHNPDEAGTDELVEENELVERLSAPRPPGAEPVLPRRADSQGDQSRDRGIRVSRKPDSHGRGHEAARAAADPVAQGGCLTRWRDLWPRC
jgi:RNA polymerase sigma factor for flagellar operon FliA